MQLNFDKIFFNFFENLILVILILSWSVDHWLNQFQLVIRIDHLNWSENKNIAKDTKTVTAALTHTIWKYMEVKHRPSPSSVFWRVFYHVFFGCSYHSEYHVIFHGTQNLCSLPNRYTNSVSYLINSP